MLTSMSTLKSRENSELDELKGLLQARDREIESLNAKVDKDTFFIFDFSQAQK